MITGFKINYKKYMHYISVAAAVLISVIIFSVYFSAVSSAISEDQRRLFHSGVRYYDTEDAFFGCNNFSDIALIADNDNAENVWGFFIAKGLTEEQTAGIMGNLSKESEFIPTIQERVRSYSTREAAFAAEAGGWGIAQWSFGRRDTLRDTTIRELGQNYYTMNELPSEQNAELLLLQLEFLYQEMNVRRVDRAVSDASLRGMTEWDAMQLMNTVLDATVFFHDSFERSIDSPQEVREGRGGRAQAVYDLFSGTGGLSSGCSNVFFDDIAEIAFSYAWPDYRGSTYSNQKPEYTAAISRAREAGETWFGGCGGNDCGAFVTRVIRDSGFDPNYNDENCNTTCQMRYLENNWSRLGRGDQISTADLLPGDVAIRVGTGGNFGHTFVFVGDIEGFDSQIASASVSRNCSNSRAPMAGRESLVDSTMTWFRKE